MQGVGWSLGENTRPLWLAGDQRSGPYKENDSQAPDVQARLPSAQNTHLRSLGEWGCLWWETEAEDLLSPEPWSSSRV